MKVKKAYVIGIICVLFGGWIILETGSISMKLISNEPGPRLFPYITAAGIIICSILSMIFDGQKESKETKREPYLNKAGWIRLCVLFAELILFAAGIYTIGFLFASIIMMFVFIWTLKGDKKIKIPFAILLSIVLPALLYFSFTKLFVIPLPTGALWKTLGIRLPF